MKTSKERDERRRSVAKMLLVYIKFPEERRYSLSELTVVITDMQTDREVKNGLKTRRKRIWQRSLAQMRRRVVKQ